MLRKLKAGVLSSALVAFGLSGVAWGEAGQQQEHPRQDPLSEQMPEQEQPSERADRVETVREQAKQALGEVFTFNQTVSEFGLLGINRAENEEVQTLATDIYERAQEANRDLMEQANELNLEVVGTQQAQQAQQQKEQRVQQQLQELEQTEGAQFDRQYMQIVVRAHEQAVSDLQQARDEIQQEDLRRAIDERLSTAQEHLQQARELQQRVQQEQFEPQQEPQL